MESLPELSPREQEMAYELSLGYSEKEIAHRNNVSAKTVNNHFYNIRKKWNARCAVDIARKFILSNQSKFLSMLFLMVQINSMIFTPDADLIKPVRTRTPQTRTLRKNRD